LPDLAGSRVVDDNLGRRIADLRQKLGLTQQDLADRLAVSRVAVSHLEAGMSIPGERTVVLLAGVFKMGPQELVAGTRYPLAKAERLPGTAPLYTELELLLELLANDLVWCERTDGEFDRLVLDEWDVRLGAVDERPLDVRAREALADSRRTVRVKRDARRSGGG
jgi:transcriptional regulator with XRE-family HTH domain